MPILYNDEPVEIAEGRGDLRFSSVPFDWWSASGFGQVPLVDGGVVSYARLFATQTWIAAAVMRMLTWSVRVPLKLYERTGADSRERVREGPLAEAIQEPWERGSQAELVMALLGSLLVHGNGLGRVLNGARDSIRFDRIDWRSAKPIKAFQKTIAGWEVTEDGRTSTVPTDQMLHVAWWSALGPVGVSPLQQLGVTVAIEEAAQRHQRSYLGNDASAPSALYLPKEVYADPEAKGEIRDRMNSRHGGPNNPGRVALLPADAEWKAVEQHTAREAQLVEQRKLTREEVAAVYMIPPPMLGILDKATYSNIETQREMAYTDSLAPPLVLMEQLLNAQLVRGLLKERDLYLEFDFAGILRGDRLKEIEAIREAIGTGVLTPNEGRRTLNYPSSDEEAADKLYLPMNNLAPLGSAPTTSPPDPEG